MTAALRLGGVPEHFNLPWRLALESGELGHVEATWEDQPGGTGQMLAKLESDELDMVSILTEGTVAAIAGGLPATIVQVYVESPLQWGIHVPAASDIGDVADLEGRRIAISRFRSGSHLMAFVQADRLGWDLDDDQFVVVGDLDGARSTFAEAGAEQFLWDRFMTQPLVDAGEFRRVGVEPTPWPSFVIAVRNEMLLGRTAEVGTIVDAVVGHAVGLHDRAGIADTLSSRYGITPAGAEAWLEATTFAPRSAFDPEIATTTLRTLRRAGFTD
ncbi:MAG: ABC transporter substrate-binding protein [Actinomycetota bacterium]